MKQHYTLRFAPGTVPEIVGTKEELIAELHCMRVCHCEDCERGIK